MTFQLINPVFLAINIWELTIPWSRAFAGMSIFEVDFANGPILLPITGMGTGTAQLWAGKQLLAGRFSIPVISEQSMPFSGFFWLGGGLGAGSLGSNRRGICKNNSKICFIPEPLPGWDYFWNEGIAWWCQGDVGVPVPSAGVPHSIFLGWIWIIDPNIQSSAPCWTQPLPTQESSPQIQLLSKNYLNRSQNGEIYPEGAVDGSQIQNLPWKAKPGSSKGRKSCAMSCFIGLMLQVG